jgi:ABC-type antimicrobial peptide transport system permease subunit
LACRIQRAGGDWTRKYFIAIGDVSIGKALLAANHDYNVSYDKVNEKFVGASQLVILAEGKQEGVIKDPQVLQTLERFQRFMEQQELVGGSITVTTMATIYTGLAAIIAFGIVYNSARISLSERARELASLRVLGFTNAETMRILLLELVIVVLVAQPPGWAIGYGLSWIMNTQLAGEIMRTPLVVENLS